MPQFIEETYFKRFKRDAPETVKPLKLIMAEQKKKEQKKAREERKKLCYEAAHF